jgi:ribosomal protein S6--L-glutamate ligase/gamma-F420-2:alpha-L-glutamate ligase
MNKKGWLIYNGGLISKKFLEINHMYISAAAKKGIELQPVKNNEIYSFVIDDSLQVKMDGLFQPDFVLFLDKDIQLAKQLEGLGYQLFNNANAIEICDDKIATYQILANKRIRMPKTLFSPMMFPGTIDSNDHFIDQVEREFDYPIVIKEAYGSFGEQVYLVENREELIIKRQELLYRPHLYQQFISSSTGKDARLYVVGEQVVASMLRLNEKDFRANVTNGGRMQKFAPPETFKELAIKASRAVGADFSGVDLLFGDNGEPIICEVNSNAHIKNVFDCTGIDVSEYIFDYILERTGYA